MKSVSPIIAGWIAGAFATSMVLLVFGAIIDLQSETPRFRFSDIPQGMIFSFFWIALAMIPGVTAALPIFYLTRLGRTGLSWLVAGLAGVCLFVTLFWSLGMLKPLDEENEGHIFGLLFPFIAASVFWQTAVFLDRERFTLENQRQKDRTGQCT